MNKFFNRYTFLSGITILIIFLLPYYLFEGKLFIGGDDTRLQYLFPETYLNNIVPFSWNRFASLGISIAHQFYLPFLVIWSTLKLFVGNLLTLNYLAFSVPLVLGFIFYKKFLTELISDDKYKLEVYAGTLFFIFSPIFIYDQLFIFLTPIWLLPLLPLVLFCYLRYLKTSNFKYVFFAIIGATVFSLISLSVPWILGLFMPIVLALTLLIFLFSKKEIIYGIKKSIIFFGFVGASQAFWLLGYILSYILVSSNSISAKVFSKVFQDTFTPTVLTTATGNVFNPLLNLFHRQIAFDFKWDLRNIFLEFYDHTFWLNFIFVIILLLGVLAFKKYSQKEEKRIYLVILVSFIISLYLFTVNIGPLKDLFILFGKFPMFTMFRNFYDKFSVGYVIIYSILITFSLIFAKRRLKNNPKVSLLITLSFLGVIIINAIPLKQTINAPVWTTENTYKKISLPSEYLTFMKDIKNNITPNNIILSLPFGSSTYTVIKEEDSNNVFLGVSPVVVFSGISDISGYLSFNYSNEANIMDQLILQRKYDEFNKIMYSHNVNNVIVTKNIPTEIRKSYAFNEDVLEAQDKEFYDAVVGKKLFTSSNGNYELYTTKKRNSIIKSDNVYFNRVNPAKFRIYIKNLKKPQDLSFLESYHGGWNLYLHRNPVLSFCTKAVEFDEYKTVECKENFKIYDDDISFFFKAPIFDDKQNIENNFSNKWTVDPEYIKSNYSEEYYKLNKDGSIDVQFDLYFQPQLYFYLGLGVTIGLYLFCIAYIISRYIYEKNRK